MNTKESNILWNILQLKISDVVFLYNIFRMFYKHEILLIPNLLFMFIVAFYIFKNISLFYCPVTVLVSLLLYHKVNDL